MKIELSEDVNKDMWVLDIKKKEVYPMFVTKESKSGETVEDVIGRRHRTNGQRKKIFFRRDFALLALKGLLEQFDDEYDEICKRLELRRVKAV